MKVFIMLLILLSTVFSSSLIVFNISQIEQAVREKPDTIYFYSEINCPNLEFAFDYNNKNLTLIGIPFDDRYGYYYWMKFSRLTFNCDSLFIRNLRLSSLVEDNSKHYSEYKKFSNNQNNRKYIYTDSVFQIIINNTKDIIFDSCVFYLSEEIPVDDSAYSVCMRINGISNLYINKCVFMNFYPFYMNHILIQSTNYLKSFNYNDNGTWIKNRSYNGNYFNHKFINIPINEFSHKFDVGNNVFRGVTEFSKINGFFYNNIVIPCFFNSYNDTLIRFNSTYADVKSNVFKSTSFRGHMNDGNYFWSYDNKIDFSDVLYKDAINWFKIISPKNFHSIHYSIFGDPKNYIGIFKEYSDVDEPTPILFAACTQSGILLNWNNNKDFLLQYLYVICEEQGIEASINLNKNNRHYIYNDDSFNFELIEGLSYKFRLFYYYDIDNLVQTLSTDEVTIVWHYPTAIKEQDYANKDITVYPNPTNCYINFNRKVSFKVFSIDGSLIISGLNDGCNLMNFKSGIYFFKFNEGCVKKITLLK